MSDATHKPLTVEEIKEVNAIIAKLQQDIDIIEGNVKAKKFNTALQNIIDGMKHTKCPACKEKLLQLSAEVIKTRASCNEGGSDCDLLVQKTVDKASEIKKDFVPVSTEKKFAKDKMFDVPSPTEAMNAVIESMEDE
ncbi:MAG: hypothetical protein KAJ39_06325 [Gammaproteobacteria bacterium]|nr:hypothetical protein [Gammaproteobacteria bacterium]